jgi:uncharacterized membrane protein YkvA (DUF1232 family)
VQIFKTIKAWAGRIKRDSVALWFAYREPGTPLAAKALCVFVVAYALSPIDLIPDFVPVLGYIDDAILLPALIWLAVRMVPTPVLEVSRAKAEVWMAAKGRKPSSYAGAVLVVAVWAAAAVAAWYWFRG